MLSGSQVLECQASLPRLPWCQPQLFEESVVQVNLRPASDVGLDEQDAVVIAVVVSVTAVGEFYGDPWLGR
jgi:hypothetical protein